MKKNKNGFTLVELLAVIVIFAVIVILAVNNIFSATKKSKDKALKASAISFIKSANDVAFQTDVESVKLNNGTFEIANIPVKLDGKKPDGGYLTFSNYEVTSGCLRYGDKYVRISDGNVENISNNKCDDTSSSKEVTYAFEYTGGIQQFKAEYSGTYKLEVWGAQGGSVFTSVGKDGGYGAYSTGIITLNKDDVLYIAVGGHPLNRSAKATSAELAKGGFNGGGSIGAVDNQYNGVAGGGATHIAFTNKEDGTLLYQDPADVVLVAGGGGGSGGDTGTISIGSSGGGASVNVLCSSPRVSALHYGRASSLKNNYDAAGGGGWIGGSSCFNGIGSGGSGYLNVNFLSDASMTCFNCPATAADDPQLTYQSSCVLSKNKSNCSKIGDGAAKITLIKQSVSTGSNGTKVDFDYTGDIQTFKAPKTGDYTLEVWGAQGGSASNGDVMKFGGYGAYSKGTVHLNANEIIYIVVGGSASTRFTKSTSAELAKGGYNGGGSIGTVDNTYYGAAGGGATHISKTTGLLSDQNQNDVIIVAGGGGGNSARTDAPFYGTSGGGYAVTTQASSRRVGSGTDQTKGAAFGASNAIKNNYDAGGGGGWYGGSSVFAGPADGGSGHLNPSLITNGYMVCYNCTVSPQGDFQVTTRSTCARTTAISDCSKAGNGHARITY